MIKDRQRGQRIAISGISGFIGSRLSLYLSAAGWDILPLRREDFILSAPELASRLDGVHAVVHLSGKPIISRWNRRNRELIMQSRVATTRRLVEAMAAMSSPPQVLVNASAVGIYPATGIHPESSEARNEGFMGEVCIRWEAEAREARGFTRVALMRTGIVLDGTQGALARMLPFFRLGLGGPLGHGSQPFPWIHIDDLLRAVEFILSNDRMEGPVNLVAPEMVTNRTFTRILADVLKRPAFFAVPAFMLKLVYGAAAETLLTGQHAVPDKLVEGGFVFRQPALRAALQQIVGKD